MGFLKKVFKKAKKVLAGAVGAVSGQKKLSYPKEKQKAAVAKVEAPAPVPEATLALARKRAALARGRYMPVTLVDSEKLGG